MDTLFGQSREEQLGWTNFRTSLQRSHSSNQESHGYQCVAEGESESGKAQIDLVIDRRDRTTNICEIKFSVSEFSIDKDYEERLKKKMQVFREATKTKKALQLVMITTYGIRQNAHSGIVQSQVRMDDLFERPE